MNKLRHDSDVGKNMRNLRKRNALTQEEITARMQILGCEGISRSIYSRYETGELNIKISHLRALKKILKCSYEDLLD